MMKVFVLAALAAAMSASAACAGELSAHKA